jgi:hypothetical protein
MPVKAYPAVYGSYLKKVYLACLPICEVRAYGATKHRKKRVSRPSNLAKVFKNFSKVFKMEHTFFENCTPV